MKILMNVFAYGSIGVFLSGAGVYANNWRFWAIMLFVVLIQVNAQVN